MASDLNGLVLSIEQRLVIVVLLLADGLDSVKVVHVFDGTWRPEILVAVLHDWFVLISLAESSSVQIYLLHGSDVFDGFGIFEDWLLLISSMVAVTEADSLVWITSLLLESQFGHIRSVQIDISDLVLLIQFDWCRLLKNASAIISFHPGLTPLLGRSPHSVLCNVSN